MIAAGSQSADQCAALRMKPTRVYHSEPLQVGRDAVLDEPASHHIGRVLRMKPGDTLTVFDGTGGEHHGVIRSVERSGVRVRIETFDRVERESGLRVGLAQVVSAGERMDLTLQKAVELGVAWIQPLTGRRAKVRLEGERAERRLLHWQRVVVAACEQSGRNRVPRVRPLVELPAWLGQPSDPARRLVLDPQAAQRLSQVAPPAGEIELLAGAESGFDDEELQLVIHHGFTPVRLGPRVLRTETAGLAALAALQALWGDF
jgi:16S rRNA (uracil1498-N3)-methyltransferase